MSDALGVLSRGDGHVDGRLTRDWAHAPGEVWAALTEPALIAEWLASGRIEARLGGRVRLDFADSGTVVDSEVSAFEAERLLELSWSHGDEPPRPVRFEVEPAGAGTRLTVVVRTPDGEDPSRACAGWEAHLAMLAAALDGAPIKFPFERFKAAREGYREQVAKLG